MSPTLGRLEREGDVGMSDGPKYPPLERRGCPRWPVVVEVSIASSHTFYSEGERFFSEDLSDGGIFVAAKCPQPLGTRLEFLFTLPDSNEPIKTTGEVQWVRQAEDKVEEGAPDTPGMGIRFIGLPREHLARIQSFILNERKTISGPIPKIDPPE